MKQLAPMMTLILAFSLLPAGAAGQESGNSTEEIARELLEVSGAGQMGVQVMHQMITSFETSMPDIPSEFWEEFMKEVDPNELVELLVPIYEKHLTVEEMEATVEFYKSPAGQAVLAKLPVIVQESMVAGQQWGMRLGEKVQKRLEEREEEE